jgi:hypothetical protein
MKTKITKNLRVKRPNKNTAEILADLLIAGYIINIHLEA